MKRSRKFLQGWKGYIKTKSEIRKNAKLVREQYSQQHINKKSEMVIKNLLSLDLDLQNKTIMSYMAIRGEINLENLQKEIKSKIYYPVIENGIVKAKSEDFKLGSYGICEPTKGEIDKSEIDICLVPGVAFSKNMQRIGFGKGYYDVFLQNYKGIKIGITYEELLAEEITPDPFDIPMDIIITENKIYMSKTHI